MLHQSLRTIWPSTEINLSVIFLTGLFCEAIWLVCIHSLSVGHRGVTAHLLWQSDDRSMLCKGGDPVCEVFATGGEYRAVGSETLAFHHHCNITQHVSEALLVQAAQHMGEMHCRLKRKHRQPGGRHGHQRHLYVGLYTNTHTHSQYCPSIALQKSETLKINRKKTCLP